MRRVLCALVVLAALVSGCRGEPEPVPTVEPTLEPTEEPTVEPTEEPTAPLTGEPAGPEVFERPVLAVKIDNARPARPPQGLELADVVIEEMVEGGTTRFIALYHSEDPGEIGPVRSGREVDADLLPAFNPVFGISGAAGVVNRLFDSIGLRTYEEGEAGAFFRQSGRRAPHNLFVRADALWEAGADLEPIEEAWQFDEEPLDGGEEPLAVQMQFSRVASAAWTWDSDRWLREQDGGPHETADEEHISATNVVVMRVAAAPGGRRDAAGSLTVELDVIGEGEALFLRDGQVFHGTWRKASAEEQFEWLDESEEPFALAPGNTWIELLPTAAPANLTVVVPEPEPTEETDGT